MIVTRQVDLPEIENSLHMLGGGNHLDNMARLRRFKRHFLVALEQSEFFNLVFLQSREVAQIVPPGGDRTLRAVANRAVELGQPVLSRNWDLAANLQRMRDYRRVNGNAALPPLVICEAMNGEERWGRWYVQDGSHRALAHATLTLLNEFSYGAQCAYCSMSTAGAASYSDLK